jgi:hypothetical protein
MACFGELSSAHCLCCAQFIDLGGASSFTNRGNHIGEVFHGSIFFLMFHADSLAFAYLTSRSSLQLNLENNCKAATTESLKGRLSMLYL